MVFKQLARAFYPISLLINEFEHFSLIADILWYALLFGSYLACPSL